MLQNGNQKSIKVRLRGVLCSRIEISPIVPSNHEETRQGYRLLVPYITGYGAEIH